MAPADKSSSDSPKREAGGGCPPPNCHPSTSYNSPNADCASTASSCCPSRCRHPQASSHRAFNSQPCTLRPILKKRSCCQCNVTNRSCLCQPMQRDCNCPLPVQVNARATHECTCDCNPSITECACSLIERRFPKATVKCPNARLCCPSPRLPSNLKCYSSSQPCPPPPCGSCTFSKCQRPIPLKHFCSPCSACPPCQPVPTALPCRLATPCRKLTFCAKRNERSSSSCKGSM
ncbi:keratin-associated protein 16-1-like isoform X1 [Cardiocondyla obscurior]|uniref:keratin-associated protein 16-1-like isoform X1 n=1 Tax=Cardiocondyla obscurior TaxID=286306 RepID=UPI0039657529